MNVNEIYMQLALDKAWHYQGLTYPNPAVGAVVTLNGKILSIEAHQKAGTSHAEILALLYAYETISKNKVDFDKFDANRAHDFLLDLPIGFFSECTIYVTLEPCSHRGKTPSCALLLDKLHLKKVIIGTSDPIRGHDGGAKLLANVTMGVLEEACKALIEPFVIWQERAFVLFKIAQTQNSKIGGGIISSEASRKHVHQLRSVCTRLLIGGNTVRVDRPILDARLSGGSAPDITIYSRQMKVDVTIPLFSVPNRSVAIVNCIQWNKCRGLILVEGGEGMLHAIREHIDWILTYTAPKLSTNNLTYNTTMNLAFLHTEQKDVDMMIWSRQIGH